jgi:hypothetical protein
VPDIIVKFLRLALRRGEKGDLLAAVPERIFRTEFGVEVLLNDKVDVLVTDGIRVRTPNCRILIEADGNIRVYERGVGNVDVWVCTYRQQTSGD